MLSLYYPEFEKLTLSDQPIPEIENDEVLVKVAACGICGSELESFAHKSERRKPPRIMGHEFSGTIVRVGNQVKRFTVGMRVVSNSVVSCGSCVRCKRGQTNLCENRQVFGMHRNGAFAEYVNVPERCLIPMQDEVDFKSSCLSEPLANGVHMTQLCAGVEIDKVLVFGAGPIGLMAQQAFQAMKQAEVIVTDIKDERLVVAKKLGAGRVVNSANENLEEIISDLTSGEGISVVVDAVGMEATNRLGLKLLCPGGTLIMIGLHANSAPFLSYDIILTEKRILGSYAATQQDMEISLDLITKKKVDVTSWVDYYPLSDGVNAFKGLLAADNKRIKTVIEI